MDAAPPTAGSVDIAKVPFSVYGSWLSLSRLSAERSGALPPGLWLRGAYGDCGGEIMHLEPVGGGHAVPFECTATPGRLTVRAGGGTLEFAFGSMSTVRVRGRGVGLRITPRMVPAAHVIPCAGGAWRINHATFFHMYQLTPLSGHLNMDAPWSFSGQTGPAWRCGPIVAAFRPDADSGRFEGAIEHFWDEPSGDGLAGEFDALAAAREAEFARFAGAFGPVPAPLRDAVRAAAHVMWSCVVEPRGNFRRPAMLMSKNWMQYVWPWDQCFNAMALAAAHPDLAWDQFMIPFDQQLPSGRLPDLMNDLMRQPAFTKRPIHGWTFRRMRLANPRAFGGERLAETYRVLSAWSDFWLTRRWHAESGLVEIHHPFEAWDNVPDLDLPMPVREPGCIAALIVQMRVLAELAEELRRPEEAADWRRRADAMQRQLLAHLWAGDHFVSKDRQGRYVPEAVSAMQCDPILLGEALPIDKAAAIEAWSRRLMTPWGPACEINGPPRYASDGGPTAGVWAPAVSMHTDGFARAGRSEVAREIADGFCSACVAGGTPEAFDETTGQPILDPAYTWTAAVFIDLATGCRSSERRSEAP